MDHMEVNPPHMHRESGQNLKREMLKNSYNEVRAFFMKLSSWKEESQRQLSYIMEQHSGSIDKVINDLVDEVCNLRERLSVITKEQNDFLGTLGDQSIEEKQLKSEAEIGSSNQDAQDMHDTQDTKGNKEIGELLGLEDCGYITDPFANENQSMCSK